MNRVAIRVIGAPLILAALAGCLLLDHKLGKPCAIVVVMWLFSAASFHELCTMGRLKGLAPVESMGQVAILGAYALAFFGRWPSGWYVTHDIGVVALLIASLVAMAVRFGKTSPVDAGYSFLMLCYVLLLSSIFMLRGPFIGWIAFLVATNKGSDMAAYVTGKLIGKHKMAPQVSPNKTWEGAAGGFLAGTVLGFLVLVHWPIPITMDPVRLWVFSASVTVAAQLGDLVKSAVKRWAGVKDSGRLLPEFGGALDMVDSFIISAPVAVLGTIYIRY